MPRLPRLHVPGGCYHVILRGNHRENLFSSDADRIFLGETVAEALTYCDARVHAYCWMGNHVHMLMQIGTQPLGRLVQRIAVRFARYRHRQLRTTGHLFERRHRAWLVDADEYFVALLRYIHLNPVKAAIVEGPEDYLWSSHRAYLGQVTVPWLTTEFGLGLFSRSLASARQLYRQLMLQPCYASEERILSDTHPDDPRVIGSDRFLASLPFQPMLPRSPLSLEELASEVCRRNGLAVENVRSSRRDTMLTDTRLEIARRAINGRIASLSQVARFLGRNRSSLSELLSRHAK
jgi:putative transposase